MTLDDLESALDRIACEALERNLTFEVDLGSPPLAEDDPLLVQFTIGDVQRAGLLWHIDGRTFAAVDPTVPPAAGDLQCVRFDGPWSYEPCASRLSPATMRQAVISYHLTDRRPEGLLWTELEAD